MSKAAEEDISRIRQILEAQETDNIRARVIAVDERTADQSDKLTDISWDESTQTSLRQEIANIKVTVTAILEALSKLDK